MRPEAARNWLQQELGLSEPPEIEISPNFVPWLWLPRRAQSIEVVIGSPESATEDEEGAEGDGGDGDGDGGEGAGEGESDGASVEGSEEELPTITPTEPATEG